MTLSISKLETNKDNLLMFSAKGEDYKFMNLLRRYIVTRVPVVAISQVTFYENSSSFFDEYISHRIGLIPLVTPAVVGEEAEIMFVLDERGPKNVYSENLKTNDPSIKVAVDQIPIVTLGEDQTIRAEAKGTLGTGQTHAKFQPGFATYEDKDNGEIIFRLESFHQIKPKDLLNRALDKISRDISDLGKVLKKAK